MRNKALLLMTLLMASGAVLAEDILTDAGKQLLKEKAIAVAPKATAENVEAVAKKLKAAKKLKEKLPASSTEVTQAVKDKAKEQAVNKALELLK